MPLRDHFHPPVSSKHRWDAVHGQWPGEIVRALFPNLPSGYVAEPKVHPSPYEVDVSAFENDDREEPPELIGDGGGGVATMLAAEPTFTVTADLSETDEYEVLVYDIQRERTLVAAVEIISPANKDRPDSRDRFVAKAAALLRRDVCVSIVDIVTEKQSNLYLELLAALGLKDPKLGQTPSGTYTVTLRGRKSYRRRAKLDAWHLPLVVGQPLPTMPLWLSPEIKIPLPLEASYEETCRLLRIA